jgi:ATP-dependent RNA helicase DeaD
MSTEQIRSEVEKTDIEESSFDSWPLSDEVRRALEEMGYTKPTPVQQAVFGAAVDRKDIIVQARTGTGKTAAFGIPIVEKIVRRAPGLQVIVLAPTRELALQTARELQRLGTHLDIRTASVYGGAPMGRQIDDLAAGAQIVSGTPGRVLDHLNRKTMDPTNLRLLVLDEMDEMLSMGFAKELNAILEQLPARRQTMCFSATVEEQVRQIAEKHMNDPEFISLSSDAISPEEVTHYMYMVSGTDRTGDLIKILEVEDPENALIFCNQKAETERVAHDLQQAGFNADWLNGDLPQSERERVMGLTREGKLRYLVATDVAARGIDISHLTHIINFTFPESTVVYVHRTGRTGRAGKAGTAISLVSPHELGELYYLRLEYKIFPVERSLPTKGEIKTRQEADRIELLGQAFTKEPNGTELSLTRRLLTHPGAERIVNGLLQGFFGAKSPEADEEAAAARRSRRPTPVVNPAGSEGDRKEGRRRRSERRPETDQPRRRRERAAKTLEEADFGESNNERVEEGETVTNLGGTLFLNLGKKDGLRVGEVSRLLRERCSLKRSEIGKIRIRDRYTFIDVPAERLDGIITALEGTQLREKQLSPERAKVS